MSSFQLSFPLFCFFDKTLLDLSFSEVPFPQLICIYKTFFFEKKKFEYDILVPYATFCLNNCGNKFSSFFFSLDKIVPTKQITILIKTKAAHALTRWADGLAKSPMLKLVTLKRETELKF